MTDNRMRLGMRHFCVKIHLYFTVFYPILTGSVSVFYLESLLPSLLILEIN